MKEDSMISHGSPDNRLVSIVAKYEHSLTGHICLEHDANALYKLQSADIASMLRSVYMRTSLASSEFVSVAETSDGDEHRLRWMTPQEVVEEATRLFPGKLVLQHRLVPAAMCLFGDDYYYFDFRHAERGGKIVVPIVRVHYDYVDGGSHKLTKEMYTEIWPSIEAFFEDESITPAR